MNGAVLAVNKDAGGYPSAVIVVHDRTQASKVLGFLASGWRGWWVVYVQSAVGADVPHRKGSRKPSILGAPAMGAWVIVACHTVISFFLLSLVLSFART
jgi:hypothetical protein